MTKKPPTPGFTPMGELPATGFPKRLLSAALLCAMAASLSGCGAIAGIAGAALLVLR